MERPSCGKLEYLTWVFRERRCDVDSCDVSVLAVSEEVTKYAELSVVTIQLQSRCHVIKLCPIPERVKGAVQEKSLKVPARLRWMFTQMPTNAYFREKVFFEDVVELIPRGAVQPELPKVVLIDAFKCFLLIFCRGRKANTGV